MSHDATATNAGHNRAADLTDATDTPLTHEADGGEVREARAQGAVTAEPCPRDSSAPRVIVVTIV